MMNSPGQIGKWLIIAGLLLCCIGGLVMVLGKVGLFRLPGDMDFGGKNWKVFVPITSCLVLSAVMTLLMWLIGRFLK
jgi:hypothetical protein